VVGQGLVEQFKLGLATEELTGDSGEFVDDDGCCS
jgi:hypothetical protein